MSDGHFGTAVNFKVPVNVTLLQSPNLAGGVHVVIRVSPLQTLVDDARYRLSFSGNILGIDFRKTFIGDNGLTGDGTSLVGGVPYVEVGGLGYVSEFLVFDRPAITRQRRLEYDPLVDNIRPEDGTTTTDPAKLNSALYNPSTDPGRALGFLSAFGDGRNGNLAASGGNTVTVSTGDTPNAPMGNPFTVTDLNPNNDYRGNPLPGGPLTYDTPTPFELQVENLTVGFKVSVGKRTIFGEEIQKLGRLVELGEFASGKGNLAKVEVIRSYQAYIKQNIKLDKKLKVVVDAGNGTAGIVAGSLLKDLGCEVDELYCDIDGRFPNHFPDPTIPANLKDLIGRMKKIGANLGIGYDGDGDRIGVADDQGNILWGDQLMILFSREILKDKKGATFVAEVKCSQNLFTDIEKQGYRAIMWRTGHSLIKEKMK